VFWIGLIIVDLFRMLKQAVSAIVGGIVFIMIGLYMMKLGVKREKKSKLSLT